MKKHEDTPEAMYKKVDDEAKEVCRGRSVWYFVLSTSQIRLINTIVDCTSTFSYKY